jgi:hypothetical protein
MVGKAMTAAMVVTSSLPHGVAVECRDRSGNVYRITCDQLAAIYEPLHRLDGKGKWSAVDIPTGDQLATGTYGGPANAGGHLVTVDR